MFGKPDFQSIENVKAFILDGPIHAFHPDSREHVAVVDYDPSGICSLEFSNGRSDAGIGDLRITVIGRVIATSETASGMSSAFS